MKNAKKWRAFEKLWTAVFILLVGIAYLSFMVWKGVQTGDATWAVGGAIPGAGIVFLSGLQFIGYLQRLREPDDDDDEEEEIRQPEEAVRQG